MVCDSISSRSRGGMKTKLIAAQLAATAGIEVIIGNGASSSIILDIFSGTFIGTVVTPY